MRDSLVEFYALMGEARVPEWCVPAQGDIGNTGMREWVSGFKDKKCECVLSALPLGSVRNVLVGEVVVKKGSQLVTAPKQI